MLYGQEILAQCLGKPSEQMALLLRNYGKLDIASAWMDFLEQEKDKLAIEDPEYSKSRTTLAHFLANPINEAALNDVTIQDQFGKYHTGVPALNYAINVFLNALGRIKVNNVNKYAVRVIIAVIRYLVDIPWFSTEHAALIFARFKYGLDISFIRKAKKIERYLASKFRA